MAKARKVQPIPGEPFTLAHFRKWSQGLICLDANDQEIPFVLEDFQASFVEDLLTGVAEAWFILPEGNGKTTLIAAIVLYHIEFKREAWVPVAAASREQAEIAYRQAAGFVERSPSLRDRFRCFDGYRKIVFKGGGEKITSRSPKMQIFAADQKTGDGVIPTLAIVDEPHRQPDMGLYRTWSGKLQKRRGQIVAISTAGEPGSEFEEARERIRQTGTVVERTETFLRVRSARIVLHEWAVPEKGNVEDLDLVKRANPFSGVTVEALKEKRESPTMTLDQWLRFTCNLPTRGAKAAITEREWHGAETDERIPEGQAIGAGLDIGWKWDTTALVPLWVRDAEFRLFGPVTVLVPPRDGNMLSPDDVKRAIRDLHARNPLHTLVMDTTHAEDIYKWAESELGIVVIDRGQSNSFAAIDYEKFMEALRNDWLKHSGDVALTTHVLNAVAVTLENGKVKFERPSQSRFGGSRAQAQRVIDALVAAAMVHTTLAAELDGGSSWIAA